jgi:hypothetical protein
MAYSARRWQQWCKPMFQLDSTYRPKRQKVKGENNPNNRQAVLFAGMNCLPGQTDLFPTDGREEPRPFVVPRFLTPEQAEEVEELATRETAATHCALCDLELGRQREVSHCGVYHPACAEKHAAKCEPCRRDYFPE